MSTRTRGFTPALLLLALVQPALGDECVCVEVYQSTARLEVGQVIRDEDVRVIELPPELVGDFNVRPPRKLVGERVHSVMLKGDWIQDRHVEPVDKAGVRMTVPLASRLVGRLRAGARVDVLDLDRRCAVSNVELERPAPGAAVFRVDEATRERLSRISAEAMAIAARPDHLDPGPDLEPCP